jgi:hypothetical protein
MAEATKSAWSRGLDDLKAYGRQGLAELRAALPLADSPIAQPTDYDGQQLDENSVVGSRVNQIMADTRGKDDQDKGIDRE